MTPPAPRPQAGLRARAIAALFMGPMLRDLPPVQARLISATRAWCAGRIGGVDAGPRIRALLVDDGAALAFDRYMETVLAAWPDNPAVCRPCCGFASHDELAIAGMVAHAGTADRAGFDRLVGEMMDGAMRDALYARALTVAAGIAR